MIKNIQDIAQAILDQNPGPVVRCRLLRDVLGMPAGSAELLKATHDLEKSRWVQILTREQRSDGGWGAFHGMNSPLRQWTPTTEVGVERALALGLESDHPVLVKAAAYLVELLENRREFPDYHEKNHRWPTGMRLFLASTLAKLQPDHPAVAETRQLWVEIARRTFQSGKYKAHDEIRAHTELTGATVKGSYLELSGKYQLSLLGSKPGALPAEVESAMLGWLVRHPKGLGYLEMPLGQPPPLKSGPLDRWLSSHELLGRGFVGWSDYAQPAVEWMWAQQTSDGWWDFGPRPSWLHFLPLSDDWKNPRNRRFDWTSRTLILLVKLDGSNILR